jgi:hypothetical protein
MSHYDIVRDCRVDGLFPVEVGQSRHYLRVVVTMREPPIPKEKRDGGGGADDDGDDDDEDDGRNDDDEEAEEEMLDDHGADETGANSTVVIGNGSGKKRRRSARIPKARGVVSIRDQLPLVHAGAEMRLVLRPVLDRETQVPDEELGQYEMLECIFYRPLVSLKYGAICAALRDATTMVARRAERIARHRSLVEANLVKFDSTSKTSGITDGRDTGVPRVVRQALLSLGIDFQYPVLLANLQAPFKNGDEARRQRQLETGLRGYYIVQASLMTNSGDANAADLAMTVGSQRSLLQPHVIEHALRLLTLPPHNVRASLLEQLSVSQLLDCAAQRSYVDAMFRHPRCTYAQPNAMARRVCADDVVGRRWRLAKPEQPEMQSAEALTQVLAELPPSVGLDFLWEVARWYQALPTRYGATMFECGESSELVERAHAHWAAALRRQARAENLTARGKKPKKPAPPARVKAAESRVEDGDLELPASPQPPPAQSSNDIDDAEHSEELWLPGETPAWASTNDTLAEDLPTLDGTNAADQHPTATSPPLPETGAGASLVCRTQWLRGEMKLIEPAPAECWLKGATTPLFMTVRAAETARRIVSSLKILGERVALYVVRASGYSTLGADNNEFTNRVVHTADVRAARVAANGRLPLVTLVFRSHAARTQFTDWIADHRPANRFSLATLTLEQMIGDTNLHASARLRVSRAARVVVIDAHLLCEHDMAHLLETFVACNNEDGHLALCGEVDTLAPEQHCESGAPFVDMWRAEAIRTVDVDAGRGVRGNGGASATGGGGDKRGEKRLPTDALYSITTRQSCVEALCVNVVTRARDVATCLLDRSHTIQIAGWGRRAFEAGAHMLADFLQRHLEKSDVRRQLSADSYAQAVAVQATLTQWSKEAWRAESTIITSMPYVKYRTMILRYDAAFVLDAENRRGEQLHVHRNLRAVGANEPVLSLDTLNLFLRLNESATAFSDVDHRNCCSTDDARLMSVTRHRHELRAASVMLARDCARGIDVNTSQPCLLLRPVTGGLSYGDELDAEQLFVAPLRAAAASAVAGVCGAPTRLIMPHATPEQIQTTRQLLAQRMAFYHRPPPTALCTMLELAVKARAVNRQVEANVEAMAGGDVNWDDDYAALLED